GRGAGFWAGRKKAEALRVSDQAGSEKDNTQAAPTEDRAAQGNKAPMGRCHGGRGRGHGEQGRGVVGGSRRGSALVAGGGDGSRESKDPDREEGREREGLSDGDKRGDGARKGCGSSSGSGSEDNEELAESRRTLSLAEAALAGTGSLRDARGQLDTYRRVLPSPQSLRRVEGTACGNPGATASRRGCHGTRDSCVRSGGGG
ncbi:unnamed protein product, partial [Discosporangium mesarthrocarpum]